MQQLIVELTPAEVDPYAGFLNLDDETLVTMAFARDNNETSNKWYVAAKKQASPLTGYELTRTVSSLTRYRCRSMAIGER